ncbi:MAG: 3-methylcrotonyl-CoA carboxylase, partial [Betaproteobacteria bacterium]
EAGFLPATGSLQVLRWPEHVAFERHDALPRVDAGVREGDAISPYYDSMIAKLIVWGEDRPQALARLDAALAQTHIVGLHTNVAFLRRTVQCPSFAQADLDTALIEREREALFAPSGLSMPLAVAALALHELQAEAAALAGPDPWSRSDGWRLHGPATRSLSYTEGEQLVQAQLLQSPQGLVLAFDGQTWPLSGQQRPYDSPGLFDLALGPWRCSAQV